MNQPSSFPQLTRVLHLFNKHSFRQQVSFQSLVKQPLNVLTSYQQPIILPRAHPPWRMTLHESILHHQLLHRPSPPPFSRQYTSLNTSFLSSACSAPMLGLSIGQAELEIQLVITASLLVLGRLIQIHPHRGRGVLLATRLHRRRPEDIDFLALPALYLICVMSRQSQEYSNCEEHAEHYLQRESANS